MALAPGGEHGERHLAARRHTQRLLQLAKAQEVDVLLRILEAQRGVQHAGALGEVGRQRDVQHPTLRLAQPRQRDRSLARASGTDDHQRCRMPEGLVLCVVEDDGLVEQFKVCAARAQPAQGRRVMGQRWRRRVCGRVTLDAGFVHRGTTQEARALVRMVLDHLERQADGLCAAVLCGPVDACELQQ